MTARIVLSALAGQPNSGKSTVFNMLTGARQHVANYPGVTVEKKTGSFSLNGSRAELVDLPGTYSLTSYSPEERVARDFLLQSRPAVTINVVDASNLQRHLHLTFQLLEMGAPVVLALNMMDVAERRGAAIDTDELARSLGVPVVPTVAKHGRGGKELKQAVKTLAAQKPGAPLRLDYGPLEPHLADLECRLADCPRLGAPARWLAVKLLEDDAQARELVLERVDGPGEILERAGAMRRSFEQDTGQPADQFIALSRHKLAGQVTKACVARTGERSRPLSDRIDALVCNRYAGPVLLVAVLYALYHLSIVQGYALTNLTWPYLAKLRDLAAAILPAPGYLEDPLPRALGLWFVDSVNALLNYIPIFFILFSLIAVIEDSGYMPRIAFLLDRLFRRFGLHGQSTLPLILGGVYVGGCAIPGVMACRAIPDERARLATILIVPLMNCLAKAPLYVLLVGAYFADSRGPAMFFIATVTILIALPVAKVLSATVLKNRPSAPFILEMPPYHMPTIHGVLRRAVERIWLFLKKIVTIVAAVAVIIFMLLQFPGVPAERMAELQRRGDEAVAAFQARAKGTEFEAALAGDGWLELLRFEEDYKDARMGASSNEQSAALNQEFQSRSPEFFAMIKGKGGKDAKTMRKELKKFINERKAIRRDMKRERLDHSFLGRLGRFLEPVTKYAGFNWRVNVSLLSAFAAKESTVATLGALYEQGAENGEALEGRMKAQETGFTALHALALMLFMALYPPCIAATIMVKIQSGETKWMLFAMAYPMVLGLAFSTLVFSGGSLLGLTGLEAMGAFYGLALCATVAAALWNPKNQTQED
ncbi:ferrous iron transport protein B [Desulfocurvus sp. DL9XJH121]